jgi:hypothetical protein
MKARQKTLPPAELTALLATLEERFEKNSARHKGVAWTDVLARLDTQPEKLWSLAQMEATGGEPDVVDRNSKTGEVLFVDCSPETPKGRVSLCYDREGWESRKEHRPKNTAIDLATEMGAELLTEEQYLELQSLGEFDRKTSSWVLTPPGIRERGGALYCERRYGRVFTGHNGAQSYYAVRGFRARLVV